MNLKPLSASLILFTTFGAAQAADLDPAFLLLPSSEIEWRQPAVGRNPPPGVQVGDRLELKVAGAGDKKIDLPPGTESLLDQGWQITTVEQNPKTSDLYLLAVPLKAGSLTLPSLALQDATGKSLGRTNPFSVNVVSAIKSTDPKPEEPVALRPPVGLGFPWWVVAGMGIFALIALCLLIYGLIRFIQNQKGKAPPKVELPTRPEDQLALEALERLAREDFLKQGLFKKHYFGISEILKNYLGARYRFDAPESTAHEIIDYLEQSKKASNQILDRLDPLFVKLDRVKFTDHVPLSDEGAEVFNSVKELVMMTRRLPITGEVNAVQ